MFTQRKLTFSGLAGCRERGTLSRQLLLVCMSLKTADNILGVFEAAIIVLSFAGWAALGFPA